MATDKCLLIIATGQQADKGDFFFKTIPNNTQVSLLTALSTTPTDTATRCSTVFSEYTQVTVTTGALGSQYNCDWLYASKRPTSSWRHFQSSKARSF